MATTVGEAVIKLKFDGSDLKSSASKKNIEEAGSNSGGFFGSAFAHAAGNLISSGIQTAMNSVTNLAKSIVNVGMDFEAEMSKVSAISGATGDDLDTLSAKAKEMGASTKFTATESGQAFEYMAMAGWKTEDMLDGIEGIMSLAAASGEDLATTSDIVTDALTAFGLQASDSGHFADILAAASANANTNVSMLGESFKYVAPVAGAMKYSAEDTSVALGLMANAGIKASQAGTSLRSIMTRMADPTDEVAVAMNKIGVSLTDTEGNMKSFEQVMADIQKGMSGLSEVEKTQIASSIAGKNAMSGFLAIANAAPADIAKLTSAIKNADGSAAHMADTMQDNLAGSLTILKSEWEAAQLALYEGDIAGFFSNLDKVLGHVGDIIIQAAPTVIEGITALIGAVAEDIPYVLYELAPTIADGIVGIIAALLNYLPSFIDGLVGLILGIADALVSKMPMLLQSLTQAIVGVFMSLTSPEYLKKILQIALTLFMTIVEAVPDMIVALVDALPQILDNIIKFLTDPHNIGEIIKAAVKLFFGIVEAVPKILGSLLSAFGTLVGNIWNGIKNLFSSFAANFGGAIGNVFKGAINSILGFVEHFFNFPINILNGFIDTINWAFGWLGVHMSYVRTISLPRLAEGGAASTATPAIFGEAGTEVVLPLEQNQDNWAGLLASTLAEEMANQEDTRSNVTVYMTNEIASGLDADEIGERLMTSIRRVA